jgi:hypothetical protein
MSGKWEKKPKGFQFKKVRDLEEVFYLEEVTLVGDHGFALIVPTRTHKLPEFVVEVIAGVFRRPKHLAVDSGGGEIPLRKVGQTVFDQRGTCYSQDSEGKWKPLAASAGLTRSCVGPQKRSSKVTNR